MPTHPHRVDALVQSAYRRCLLVLGIEQAALAVSLAFAGLVLLLLAGTQVLDWYWLVLLVCSGAVLGYVRVRRRAVTRYAVAQTLDRKLRLADTISTAWYLKQRPDLSASPAGSAQIAQADRLARNIDARQVFPFRGSRSWAIVLMLATTALALFTVRYLLRRDLNLQPALVPMHFAQLAARIKNQFAAVDRSAEKDDVNADPSDSREPALTEPDDPRMNDVVGIKNPAGGGDKEAKGPTPESAVQTPNQTMQASNSEKGNQSVGKPNSSGNVTDQSAKNSEQGQDPKAPADANQQKSGLMDRMKDAVSSLFAKMNESPPQSAQTNARNSAAPDEDQNRGQSDQGQSQSSASQNSQANADAKSKSDQQGQASEVSQAAQTQSSQASDRPGGNQSKSGIGRQDGQKELKEAQEQEAMGKLAEIIGKRSQNVTGEMMVEVPSGKQQLRTAYSGRIGQHSDTGGEINRDEVPLIFQEYVREYMERVRKQAQHNN